MLSVAFSSSLSVLEEVVVMPGVEVQRGSFQELPGVGKGMLFMRIENELYSTIAAMGAVRVLNDTPPWEKDVYSVPISIADWLDGASYI